MKSKIVYKRIAQEMLARGIDARILASQSGMSYDMMCRRLRGASSFLVEEAVRIHQHIGQDITIEELFVRE